MNSLNSLWEGCTSVVRSLPEYVGLIPRDNVSKVVVQEVHMITGSREGRMFVRLAGIAGATAVIMAAYGAHGESMCLVRNDDRQCVRSPVRTFIPWTLGICLM